jgi:hypothetical protein
MALDYLNGDLAKKKTRRTSPSPTKSILLSHQPLAFASNVTEAYIPSAKVRGIHGRIYLWTTQKYGCLRITEGRREEFGGGLKKRVLRLVSFVPIFIYFTIEVLSIIASLELALSSI